MSDIANSSEDRLSELLAKINRLEGKLTQVTTRLEALEHGHSKPLLSSLDTEEKSSKKALKAPEVVWDMVGRDAMFSRIAAVCFMLVAALILRTITDSNIINMTAGLMIGLAYTAGLVAWGWRMYAQQNRLAPVFPFVGTLLLLSIVLETHAHFESLTTFWAYAVIMAIETAIISISIRFNAKMLLYLGIYGIFFAGIAIDFPKTNFLFMTILLWAINLSAFLAYKRNVSHSSRWGVLFLSTLLWIFWAYKLSVPLARGEAPSVDLAHNFFFPLLTVFTLSYFLAAVYRVVKDDKPLGFFHGILPTVNVVTFFLAGKIVSEYWFESPTFFGIAATSYALLHFLLADRFSRANRKGAPGCNALTFAGALLIALGLPMAVGRLEALPMLSILAFFLAYLAYKWQSGGVRLTSYLLQGLVCIQVIGMMPDQFNMPVQYPVAAAVMAIMAIGQYYWCRNHKPAVRDSAYFSWLDRRDIGAVILLLAGLLGLFALFRLGLHQVTAVLPDHTNAFSSGQSILVNLSAIILMLFGLKKENSEILIVSIAIVVVGAVRVFIFDLFGGHGLPLVASVFSFGIVALIGSLTWKKWYQILPQEKRQQNKTITVQQEFQILDDSVELSD